MQKEKIPGTLVLWPGVAEELVAGKAFMIRDALVIEDAKSSYVNYLVGLAAELT